MVRKKDAARKRKVRSSRTPGTAEPSKTKFTVATEMLAGMTDKDQVAVAESRMGKLGFSVVPIADLKKLQAKAKAKAKGDGVPSVDPKVVMVQFLAMKAADKVMFVKKAKHTAAYRKLDPLAKDINARIAKFNQYGAKAEDHKLSASLQLEVARRFCLENKIPWENWCKANIK